MTNRLDLASLPSVPESARPPYDPRELRIGLVHLGAGAFFRAHQAWYAHRLAASGERAWGILATSQRSPTVTDQLTAQDGLYSVLERSTHGAPTAQVVGVVRRATCAASDPQPVLDALADPGVHAVTLTVTEKGYRLEDGRLRLDDEVLADLAGNGPPSTVVGQLVRGLERRAGTGAGPIALVSCDNLSDNGAVLKRLVSDFADRLTGPNAAATREYIEHRTTFPCTMVDRIVPAAGDADRAEVERLLGVRDDAAVVTEPFSQWVIADEFIGPRPPWEKVGATLTDDVAGYERVKLRLLNATHSLIAYLGALAGHRTIAAALEQPLIERAARALIDQDGIPTLTAPGDLDLATYREDVLARFTNPALGHRTVQVGMDGSQKLPQRVLPMVRERRAAGAMPMMGALVIAAWMRFLLGRDDAEHTLEVSDPMSERLTPLLRQAVPAREIVRDVIATPEIFGTDLVHDDELVDAVASWFAALRDHGVVDTLQGA